MNNNIPTLDLRKIPFPRSVILTKRFLDYNCFGEVKIITDSKLSENKILEFAIKNKWHKKEVTVTLEEVQGKTNIKNYVVKLVK